MLLMESSSGFFVRGSKLIASVIVMLTSVATVLFVVLLVVITHLRSMGAGRPSLSRHAAKMVAPLPSASTCHRTVAAVAAVATVLSVAAVAAEQQ